MAPRFGIRDRLVGDELPQIDQELCMQRSPARGSMIAAGAGASPEIGHPSADHEDQIVGGGEQAVAQEACDFGSAARFLDAGAGSRRSGRQPLRVAAQLSDGHVGKPVMDVEGIQQLDSLENLLDAASRMPRWRRPQPRLHRQSRLMLTGKARAPTL